MCNPLVDFDVNDEFVIQRLHRVFPERKGNCMTLLAGYIEINAKNCNARFLKFSYN